LTPYFAPLSVDAHPYLSDPFPSFAYLLLPLPLLPLATTTTTVAPWLHRRRLRRRRIVIGTAVTTVLPLSSVIYLIVVSSCPLPSIVVRYSSFFTHFITISPLVPPSFVDC
jgi:hypothetical protein